MTYGNKKTSAKSGKKAAAKAGQKTSRVGQRQSYKQTAKAPGNGHKS